MSIEYLFVRVLEACNADCFMCGFRRSREPYRFGLDAMECVLDAASADGVRVVRMTGGEPLMHAQIVELVAAIAARGMAPSLITNGALLTHFAARLASAGLAEAIVSIDGAIAQTHDAIRNTPRLFERAIAGVRAMLAHGVRVRVNTVAGPGNAREMPLLQNLLTELGVNGWELSSLKLERPLEWDDALARELDAIVAYVYRDAAAAGRLVPSGKVWCGGTPEERTRYLRTGVTPRPDIRCHVVDRVRYYDPRNGFLYPCSLLPHRPYAGTAGARVALDAFQLTPPALAERADHYRARGPWECTGCSATAAGYSAAIAAGSEGPWAF